MLLFAFRLVIIQTIILRIRFVWLHWRVRMELGDDYAECFGDFAAPESGGHQGLMVALVVHPERVGVDDDIVGDGVVPRKLSRYLVKFDVHGQHCDSIWPEGLRKRIYDVLVASHIHDLELIVGLEERFWFPHNDAHLV